MFVACLLVLVGHKSARAHLNLLERCIFRPEIVCGFVYFLWEREQGSVCRMGKLCVDLWELAVPLYSRLLEPVGAEDR